MVKQKKETTVGYLAGSDSPEKIFWKSWKENATLELDDVASDKTGFFLRSVFDISVENFDLLRK